MDNGQLCSVKEILPQGCGRQNGFRSARLKHLSTAARGFGKDLWLEIANQRLIHPLLHTTVQQCGSISSVEELIINLQAWVTVVRVKFVPYETPNFSRDKFPFRTWNIYADYLKICKMRTSVRR